MALEFGEKATIVADRMRISGMLTHCKKCGADLITSKAQDHTPPSSPELFCLVTFTCPNQRWWNSHSKEYLSLLGDYKSFYKK